MRPIYPNISVLLSGEDGNAYAILARIVRAMRSNGVRRETIEAFRDEATAGDYDNLLRTCMRYVEVN